MLFTLIKNELIKLLKRGKTWIVFCLFAAVIGVTIFAQFKQDKNIRKWNSPEKQLQIAQDELEYTNNELKNINNNDNNPDYIQYLQNRKVELEEKVDMFKEIIKNGTDSNLWKAELDEKN